ncbi:MAG: BREX system Lon protease-like protein BrxL [Candidatus Tritonobacter lacicola]|nr:BREX system Lon protease-like protein BrxL [Candidatus Tritonobacter lacicola]
MKELDKKINEHFPGLVVRKDLTKIVKGNAIVPTYVLEYLLGQYCATSDGDTIESGIDRVKEILRKHYVHRNEAQLVKSTIKEKGHHKIIDRITVGLNDKAGTYEATFSNLGIKRVLVETNDIKKHPKLLVGGVWCIIDIAYEASEDPKQVPWTIDVLKPIQVSHFDYDSYCEARRQFSTTEWIDVLLQSIGLNPEIFDHRRKMLQLIRLIPYCERNYNLIELGPKGTGKSHIYSEFSPHGILISGGEVTVPKLFVNNATGKIGLVGYWDIVAFDEFAGKDKKVDKSLVDIMKNYMANKSFSRGIETLGAEASLVFIGNTRRSLTYMLKHADLFTELPAKYYDTAFLDRLHFYIPGWEVDIIRGEMFTSGYGFIVDYLAEILKKLRIKDCSQLYTKYFELDSDISTRDRDAIHKTFSGLMKVIFPNQNASKEEIRQLLELAIEGRRRIKDQLLKIDETFIPVNFVYMDKETRQTREVKTLEAIQYQSLKAEQHK